MPRTHTASGVTSFQCTTFKCLYVTAFSAFLMSSLPSWMRRFPLSLCFLTPALQDSQIDNEG
jgi:hypothetical protein